MSIIPYVEQPARTRDTPAGRALPTPGQPPGERFCGSSLAVLRAAFHASGGIARRDDLARWMEDLHCGDVMCAPGPADAGPLPWGSSTVAEPHWLVSLTRLIATGEVLAFDWHHTTWVPMFQFDPLSLALRPEPRQVLAALAGAFDGWSLALWFAQPNTWLLGCRPMDLLQSDLPAVLKAARKDRFIAAG